MSEKKKRLELPPLPPRSLYARTDQPKPKRAKKMDIDKLQEFARVKSAALGEPTDKPKGPSTLITIRIENDILERWKATGKGWQGRMKVVLRKHAP